jgi:hypothetical protein
MRIGLRGSPSWPGTIAPGPDTLKHTGQRQKRSPLQTGRASAPPGNPLDQIRAKEQELGLNTCGTGQENER